MQSSTVEIGGVTASGGGVRAPLTAVGALPSSGMMSGEPFEESGGEVEGGSDISVRVAIVSGAAGAISFKVDAKQQASVAKDDPKTRQVSRSSI